MILKCVNLRIFESFSFVEVFVIPKLTSFEQCFFQVYGELVYITFCIFNQSVGNLMASFYVFRECLCYVIFFMFFLCQVKLLRLITTRKNNRPDFERKCFIASKVIKSFHAMFQFHIKRPKHPITNYCYLIFQSNFKKCRPAKIAFCLDLLLKWKKVSNHRHNNCAQNLCNFTEC